LVRKFDSRRGKVWNGLKVFRRESEFAGEGGEDREAEYREVVKAGRARARLTNAPRPVYDDAAHAAWMNATGAHWLAIIVRWARAASMPVSGPK